jgi:hypothetical protein
VNLTALREAAGAALVELDPDWTVLLEPVDAVQPPCYLLTWGPNPTRVTETVCSDLAQLTVIVIAGRLTVEGVLPVWEAMTDAACSALAVARLRPYQTIGPAPEEYGQISYLAGRIQIRRPIDV